MSKRKQVQATVLATGSVPETVQTIHGETIAVSELTHIAPYLQRFAMRCEVLTRDPQNARKHGKKDLTVTGNSLKRFGQTIPILFRQENDQKVILVGNGRHEAASNLLEWAYIAAVPFNGTREQAKAYGLADNRTAELSEWDQEKLSELIDELGDIEVPELEDFDLAEIGLGDDDLLEIEEAQQDKQKKKATTVEQKQSESVPGKFFNIVIKCGSEKHQLELLEALSAKNPKDLIKLLNGADVRTQN